MRTLQNIPITEREHFVKCEICGNFMDMRNLGQVFEHEHKNISEPSKQYASRKKGTASAWSKNRQIFIN